MNGWIVLCRRSASVISRLRFRAVLTDRGTLRMRVFLPGLFFLPCLSGCGTMVNLDGREWPYHFELGQKGPVMPQPFGGVARDLKWMTFPLWDEKCANEALAKKLTHFAATTIFWTMDVPFSLVGDVVTLPKTIPYLWMSEEEYRQRIPPFDPPLPVAESSKER